MGDAKGFCLGARAAVTAGLMSLHLVLRPRSKLEAWGGSQAGSGKML